MHGRSFASVVLAVFSLSTGLFITACHNKKEPEPEERSMVDVDVPEDGRVRVRAPFVNVEVDRRKDRHRRSLMPVDVVIDHAAIACRDLEQSRAAYAAIGLPSVEGGAHANGTTHMAIVAFPDGSYLELIAPVNPNERDLGYWPVHLRRDAGPCGWAIRSNDVSADAARLHEAGIAVQGPFDGGRRRPDGTEIQWKFVIAGAGPPGAVLPFLIQDVTDRTLRVPPAPADDVLSGLALVVLGVDDLDDAADEFQQAFGWSDPSVQDDTEFGARLAHIENTPVVLAAPLHKADWLDERIDELGDGPAAYLIGTAQFDAALQKFDVRDGGTWFGRRIAWFNPAKINGTRLGLIEAGLPGD